MCTAKINYKSNKITDKSQRFAQIAKLGEIIFHAKDLANLWQITNVNTLHTTLKRYEHQGLLYRIYRGFYALKPVDKLDPLLLGVKALHEYCYISAETVLAKAGIIFQVSNIINLISSKSKKFSIGNYQYCSRKLADQYLFNPVGLTEVNGVKIADLNRAVADLLYFNPKFYFDAAKLIDWRRVKKTQIAVGYPLTLKRYDFTKPKRSRA